jgi:ribonuclease HI
VSAKPSDKVIIFTDGACSGNPGPGGWAAILVSPLGKIKEIGGAERHTTNNKMELTATLEALRLLGGVKKLSTKEIRLYTDSKYVIQGITSWIHGWKRNGWKNAEGKDVSNRELWEALADVILKHAFKVEWLYVPGHSGFGGNERCDEIAVAYSKNLPIELFQGDSAHYRVDISRLPAPVDPSAPSRKKFKPVYISYVNGELHRDADWKSCEARVKGRPGAKFKKVESPEEEADLLAGWGVRAP